jgi:hypothetical protein
MTDHQIHAVIGVWYQDGKTFYVRRSAKMENYPNVWSLLSIQFNPSTFAHDTDCKVVQPLMEQMSRERLGGAGIRVVKYLSSSHCFQNPMNKDVYLHMFDVELDDLPKLNPDYYADCAWLTPEEYSERSQGGTCGLCLRMWSDYSVRHRLAKRAFAPALVAAE